MPSNIKSKHIKPAPIKNYAKNVFKSFQIATQNIVKEAMPAVSEFKETNSELFREIYTGLKDFRTTLRRTKDAIESTPIMKMANQYFENAKADLKTGKFINTDRHESTIASSISDDENFDFDMDMGMDTSFDEDYTDSSNKNTDKLISVNKANAQAVIGAVGELAKSNLESANYIVESQKALNNINLSFYTKKLDESNFYLSDISSNVKGLLNYYNTNMNKYFDTTYKFYDQMLTTQKEMYNIMKSQYDLLYNRQMKTSTNSENDLFTSEGALDIKTYFKNVRKNVKNIIEEQSMGLSTLIESMQDSNVPMEFIISPLGFIPKAIVKKFIPNILKESMASFNLTFSNFFKSLLMKFSRYRDSTENPVLSIISQIFGLKNEKKSINIGEYHKGPTPFDGVTRKAIIDVIPTYLRKILAALTGDTERVYNYDRGTYDIIDKAKNKYRDTINTMYDSSIYGTKSRVMDQINKTYKFGKEDERKMLESDIANIMRFLVNRGHYYHPYKDVDANELATQGLSLKSNKSLDIFTAAFRQLSKGEQLQFNSEMIDAINNRNSYVDNARAKMELEGISNAMADWSPDKKSSINRYNSMMISDKYGETTHSYLRKLLSLLYSGIIVFPRYYGGSGSNKTPPHIKKGLEEFNKPELDLLKRESDEKRIQDEKENKRRIQYREKAEKESRESLSYFVTGLESLGDADEIEQTMKYRNLAEKDMQKLADTKDPKSKIGRFFARVKEYVQSPFKLLSKGFDFLDRTLYKIIYGNQDPQKLKGPLDIGFLGNFVREIKDAFKNDILKPLEDRLFNNADAIFPRIKGWFKKTLFDPILGSDFSIKNEGKSIWNKIKAGINQILFGEKSLNRDKDGKLFVDRKKGILSGLQDRFYTYFNELSSTLWGGKKGYNDEYGKEYKNKTFGGEKKFKQFKEDLQQKFKERFPNMAIGGGLGLIGSFFLPGGPIFGTLLGAGISFAKQSNTIKNFLFGEEIDDVDDEGNTIRVRKGNRVFSKEFMKKYKTKIEPMIPGIKKGMGIGALSSLLLGFGPVTGLLLGGTISWAKQSEDFKRFIFGGYDKDGKYKKGLFNEELKDKIKKYLPSIGKGAGLGLIGNLALGGGPLFGILAGGSLGFISELDIVKDKLFGPLINGERHGGWIDQIKEVANKKIFEPIKEAIFGSKEKKDKIGIIGKMKEWFKESISDPFKAALRPLTEEMKIVGRSIADIFKETFNNVFENAVGKPLGKLIEEKVVDPLKRFLSKIIGGIGRFVGRVLSAPFKALSAFAGGIAKDHLRSGVRDRQGNRVSNYLDDYTDEQLEQIGLTREQVNAYNREDKVSGFEAVKRFADKIFGSSYKKASETSKKMQNSVNNFINNLFKKNAEYIPISERIKMFMSTSTFSQVGGFKLSWTKFMNRFSDIFRVQVNKEKQKSQVQQQAEKKAKQTSESIRTEQKSSDIQQQAEERAKQTTEGIKQSGISSTSLDERDINKSGQSSTGVSDSRSISSILRNIEKYTGITSNEVKGQLDGVGYNVEKIKNILKNNFGDADAKGLETDRGNKKRKGLLGKIFDFLKHPLNFIKNLVTAPFKFIGGLFKDAFKPFMETLGSVTKAILNIPQHIIKILGDVTGLIVNGLKFALDGITNVLKVGTNLIMSSLEGIANIIVGIGEGLANAFSALGNIVNTTVSVISELALKAIPKLIEGFGSLLDFIGRGLSWLGHGVASLFGKGKKKIVGSKVDTVNSVKLVNHVKTLDKIKEVVNVYVTGGKLDQLNSRSGSSTIKDNISFATNKIADNVKEFMDETGEKPKKDVNFILQNKEKEKEKENQDKMTDGILSIADSSKTTAEHMTNAFGNKGIFSKLFGDGEGEGFFSKIFKSLPTIFAAITALPPLLEWFQNIGGAAGKAFQDSDGDGFADADKNKDGSVTGWEKLMYTGKEALNMATENNPRTMKRFKAKMIVKGIHGTSNNLLKFFSKHPNAARVIDDFLFEFLQAVCKQFPRLQEKAPGIYKGLSRLAGNATEEGLQSIATLSSGWVLEVAFFVYDAITGMFDVRNILQIPQDTPVTWNMRMSCALAKALSGLVMDLPSLFGIGWKEIAIGIYGFMGTDEEVAQLKEAQQLLQEKYSIAQKYGYSGTFDEYNDATNSRLISFDKFINYQKEQAFTIGAATTALLKGKPDAAKKVVSDFIDLRKNDLKSIGIEAGQIGSEFGRDSIFYKELSNPNSKIRKKIASGQKINFGDILPIIAEQLISNPLGSSNKAIKAALDDPNSDIRKKLDAGQKVGIGDILKISGLKITDLVSGKYQELSKNIAFMIDLSNKVKTMSNEEILNYLNMSGMGSTNVRRLSGKGSSVMNNAVYYSQADGKWADQPYSGDKMKTTGCAPTAAAMVISTITGKNITPSDTARFATAGGYDFNDYGTNFVYIGDVLTNYNIPYTFLEKPIDNNKIISALTNGNLVILLGRSSSAPFTRDGHFVVATSIEGNSIYINDPIGKDRSKKYATNNVIKNTEAAWIIEPNGSSATSTSYGSDIFGEFGQLMTTVVGSIISGKPISNIAVTNAMSTGTSSYQQKIEEPLISQSTGTVPIKHGETFMGSDGKTIYTKISAPYLKGKLTAGTHELLVSRVSRLGSDYEKDIDVASSYRSISHQQNLYDLWKKGKGNRAAVPGNSAHNFGLAIDTNSNWVQKLSNEELKKYKLWKPMDDENWHIEPVETKGNRSKDKYPNVVLSGAGLSSKSRGKVQRINEKLYGFGDFRELSPIDMSPSPTNIISSTTLNEILEVLKSINQNTQKASENKVTIVVDEKDRVKSAKNNKYNNTFLNIVDKNKEPKENIDYENAIIIAEGTF